METYITHDSFKATIEQVLSDLLLRYATLEKKVDHSRSTLDTKLLSLKPGPIVESPKLGELEERFSQLSQQLSLV